MRRLLLASAALLVALPALAQTPQRAGSLSIQNALSEIASNGSSAQSAARGNLGLGSIATQPSTAFAPINNPTFSGTVGIPGTLQVWGTQSWTSTRGSLTNSNFSYLSGAQTINGATITGAFAPVNILQIYDNGIAVPAGVAQGLYIQYNMNSASATGGRNAGEFDINITHQSGNTGGQYSAVQGNCASAVPEPSGICYGANFTSLLRSGASGWAQVVGQENDVGVQSGAGAPISVTGMQVVPFSTWSVAGSAGNDSAYVIGDQSGAIGFDDGFRISGIGGSFPIKTTGAVFKVTTAGTVVDGFNTASLTYTGNSWNDGHVTISGAGIITAPSLLFTLNSSGAQPASLGGGGGALTWNYGGGSAEVDFWNLYNNAASSFNFYQKTGASTSTLDMSINTNGVTIGGLGNINSTVGILTTGSLVQITPATRTLTTTFSPAFTVNQNLAGTITAAAPIAVAASFNILSDTVNAAAPGEIYDLYVGSNFGGGTFRGGRVGITSFMTQTGPSAVAPGVATYIVAGLFSSQSSINEGGTSGSPSGNLFGLNNQVFLNAGATFWNSIVGQELDMLLAAGASAAYKTGLQIVLVQADATAGSVQDAALVFAAQQSSATPGWKNVIQFGGPQSVWPVNPTSGVLIGTASTSLGGRAYAAAIGMDFSAIAFSTAFLKSVGFLVDGSGNITAPSLGNGASGLKISGSGAWSSNGAIATTMTSLGPTGSHATVQEWLTIADAGGTVRYVPAY